MRLITRIASSQDRPSLHLTTISTCFPLQKLVSHLAGSSLRETSLSVDEHLERLDKGVGKSCRRNEKRPRPTKYSNNMGHKDVSSEDVRKKGADGEKAAKLFQLSSFFDNTKIQHSLFINPRTTECEPFTIQNLPYWFQDIARSPLSLKETISILSNYSLIEQIQASKDFSVHPVVHEWSYHFSLDIHADLCRTAALLMVSGAVDHSDASVIRSNSELLPHTRRLVQVLENKFGMERGRYCTTGICKSL